MKNIPYGSAELRKDFNKLTGCSYPSACIVLDSVGACSKLSQLAPDQGELQICFRTEDAPIETRKLKST
jgi:hypothetical protein